MLWRKAMRAVLVQFKVAKAVDNSYAVTLLDDKKSEIDEIAMSTIILHLSDNVIRKVDDVKTTAQMWLKLEQLYLVKSLRNRILLLEQFFSFKMDVSKDLDVNLNVFKRLMLNPANCKDVYSDEVKSAIKYGRDELSLETVINSLRTKI